MCSKKLVLLEHSTVSKYLAGQLSRHGVEAAERRLRKAWERKENMQSKHCLGGCSHAQHYVTAPACRQALTRSLREPQSTPESGSLPGAHSPGAGVGSDGDSRQGEGHGSSLLDAGHTHPGACLLKGPPLFHPHLICLHFKKKDSPKIRSSRTSLIVLIDSLGTMYLVLQICLGLL